MAATSKMDLTTGSIPIQIWKFNLPLILTVMLQTVFHATDVAVVGHFSENAENAVHVIASNSERELELKVRGELIYSQNASLSEDKIKLSQFGFALIRNNKYPF